jgi:hypothetical protein
MCMVAVLCYAPRQFRRPQYFLPPARVSLIKPLLQYSVVALHGCARQGASASRPGYGSHGLYPSCPQSCDAGEFPSSASYFSCVVWQLLRAVDPLGFFWPSGVPSLFIYFSSAFIVYEIQPCLSIFSSVSPRRMVVLLAVWCGRLCSYPLCRYIIAAILNSYTTLLESASQLNPVLVPALFRLQ